MDESTKLELIRRKIPGDRISAKGIPIDPVFKPQNQKNEMLKKHGLASGRLTLLITSGSFGIASYHEVLTQLETIQDKIQCFVVCGNNDEVRVRLLSEKYAFPVKVLGFVNYMHELMEASDLMIAKSGGLTTSESLAKGIPMIVTQPIPGQETRNTDFLKSHEAAFFMNAPDQAKIIIQAILNHPEILTMKKQAIHKIAKPDAAKDLAEFVFSLLKP
jgi:processive 1,2-diacylglycerol beta-glucosyltransferase